MHDQAVAVAVHDSHALAEQSIQKLRDSGFDMKVVSILGRETAAPEDAAGFHGAADRVRFSAELGVFWGGLLGALLSPARFLLPGLGSVLALGPVATVIADALEGAIVAGGAGALAGALGSIGIPHASSQRYEDEIKAGKFLVMVRGTPEQAARAHEILDQGGTSEIHPPPPVA